MTIKDRIRKLEAKRERSAIDLIEIPWEARNGEPVYWTMLIAGGPKTRREWKAAYPDKDFIFHNASDRLKEWERDQS